MNKIHLIQNNGFHWFKNDTISVKGCFFDDKNNFYEKSDLLDYFKSVKTKADLIDKITEANGIFTVIIKIKDIIMIASDTSRIFPLFYSFQKNSLFISDDIVFLKTNLKISVINKQSETEFNSAAHTIGNKTLLKNIYQTQSNEFLIFQNNKLINQQFFFSYSTNKLNPAPYESLKSQAIQVFEETFKRLIISLQNRPVILPLSGGYDSRLIALMLKKHNYTNVICFTFGKKNNFETENSKKTAEALNFKWLFIEYSKELINNYIETESFKEYVHFAGKYSSMPFLQEYFAVKYLKDNNLIAENSVFIPGHSGDLLGGSQLIKVVSENLKPSGISNLIVKKKFFYNSISDSEKPEIKKAVKNSLLSFNPDYQKDIPYSVFEDYDIKEKLTKFIFNSTSVFNFFGFEQRFPYWDKKMLCFFKNVPFEYKKMKLLYDDVLKNHFFKSFNLNFEKEIQSSLFSVSVQKIKNRIKPILPFVFRKQFLIKNDWKNYEAITNQMLFSIKKNNLPVDSKIKKYNEIIIRWYLLFIKGLIK